MRSLSISLILCLTSYGLMGQAPVYTSTDSFGSESRSGTIRVKKVGLGEIPNGVSEEKVDKIQYESPTAPDPQLPNDTVRNIDPPIFNNNGLTFEQYISRNMNYPQQAIDNGTWGVVTVVFVIDQSGFVRNARVTCGLGSGCDAEALRLLKGTRRWIPAKQNGRVVQSMVITKEIKFDLETNAGNST